MNPQQQPVGVPLDFNQVLEEYQSRNAELEKKDIMNNVYIRQLNQQIADLKAELAELKGPEESAAE